MNELLPYVKNEIGQQVRLPPQPVWDDHVDKFLELTKEFECKSSENFEQAKTWADMGVRLKADMFASFAPYFDFLDQLRDPVIERRNRYVQKVAERMNLLDSSAIAWKREQDKILELEQEKKDQEELQRRLLEREELLEVERLKREIADEFGTCDCWDVHANLNLDRYTCECSCHHPIVELPPVVPPRHTAVDSPFSYRKGKRSKPKLIATITEPEKVKREYCEPDKTLINLKVANYAKQVIKPTAEQIAKLAEEIGGVIIKWE